MPGWSGQLDTGAMQQRSQQLVSELRDALRAAGYTAKADTQAVRVAPVLGILRSS